jgi:hypothetical protein
MRCPRYPSIFPWKDQLDILRRDDPSSLNRADKFFFFGEGIVMDMSKIKEKAKQLGIQAGKMKKVDLIRAIQSKEEISLL